MPGFCIFGNPWVAARSKTGQFWVICLIVLSGILKLKGIALEGRALTNPDSIRRTNAVESVMQAAFAGVPWRDVFSVFMSEFNIQPAEVEAAISKKRSEGMNGFTPSEISKLDDYFTEWLDVIGAPCCEQLIEEVQPVIDRLYANTLKISKPPKIMLCESPAKLAIYMKLLVERKGDEAIYSAEQFRALAQQVVVDLASEERAKFVQPLEVEFNELLKERGPNLMGRSLTYRVREHILQEFGAELRNETTGILKSDSSEFFTEALYYRFEAIRRRLNSIFDIDFHFLGNDHDAFGRGHERMMRHWNPFNKETFGFWQGYSLIGAGFLMEHLSARGSFSPSCQTELSQWLCLFHRAPWFSFFENVCLVGMNPVELFLDEQLRLNNRDGAAATFADGWKTWAIDGARVPRRLSEDPASLTVEDISNAQNANIRRIMIDLYGASRYLEDSGSRLVSKDEYGELYQRELPDDEPLTMVRVKNSTMEPDGTFRYYFLRVPPNMMTAKEAVAWTFGLESGEYQPDVET